MSQLDEYMTPERQWQITENIRLAREYFREYLDDPEAFAGFTDGKPIVLLPADAEDAGELTHANLQMAHHLAQQGRDVIIDELGTRLERHPVQLSPMRDRG